MFRKIKTPNHILPNTNQQGQTLLEITIAIAILGWIIVTAVSSYVNLTTSQLRSRLKIQATQYAREGSEIAYNISLQDWDNFDDLDGDYHPVISSNVYILVPGSETISNKFERTVRIEKARRDANGDLSDTGAQDPDTMKVVSSVVIDSPTTNQEIKLTSYLINLENI